MKDIKKVKAGKKALDSGRRFENKVRKDLESKGWIVSRWQNNVEFKEITILTDVVKKSNGMIKKFLWNPRKKLVGSLIPAKQGKFRKTSTGFPDFIIFQQLSSKTSDGKKVIDRLIVKDGSLKGTILYVKPYTIFGIECRAKGYLDKEEVEKCFWLLENGVFSKIFIAKKGKKRGTIEYIDFQDKYEKGR